MAEIGERRIPRGVILIATLLIIGTFFVAGLGLLVPTETLQANNLPRSLMLVGALLTGFLAYGLLRMRRWAWASTLSFVFVQAYFLVLGAGFNGPGQYVGLALLAACGAYLLLPGTRAVFLRPRGK